MPGQNPPITSDYPKKLRPAITRWVAPGWYYTNVGNTPVLVNGLIVYQPIFVEEDTTYIRIAIDVTNFRAGATVELRIYAWNNGVPGALVLDAGAVSIATNGIKEVTISQLLARGHYFLAYRSDAAAAGANLQAPTAANAVKPPCPGVLNVAGGTLTGICLSVNSAWADPAPAPTAYLEVTSAAVYLREN